MYPDWGYNAVMPEKEHIGTRIKLLREAQGLTQSQLAAAVGVTKTAVSAWECGNADNPTLPTFGLLCRVLHANYEYLIWGADRNKIGQVVPAARRKRRAPPTS
jgi:transcriptional regulator with XRE-family HTH domain